MDRVRNVEIREAGAKAGGVLEKVQMRQVKW